METITVSGAANRARETQKEPALLAQCKYYKGEAKCPFPQNGKDNRSVLWYIERSWVMDSVYSGDSAFLDEVAEFEAYGAGASIPDDGIPITLLARLFNRFSKAFFTMRQASREFSGFYALWNGEPSGA